MPAETDRPDAAAGRFSGAPLALLRLLGALPLRVLQGLGAFAGLAACLLSSSYRRKLRTNLRQAGYGSTAATLRAAAQAGRMVGEVPFVWYGAPARFSRRVFCDDLAVLDAAEAMGRGIVFLTPHLGAFEAAARFYASRAPLTVMFKPPRQAWLRPLLALARREASIRAVPATLAGVRALLRALRAGQAVALLPDQVPDGGDGRQVPFFGRPAWTMTLPQRLVQQTGAGVVLAVAERLPAGRGWRLHLEAMDEAPTPEALNARMEVLIRRFPAQYLWGYNRYKRAAAGAPD